MIQDKFAEDPGDRARVFGVVVLVIVGILALRLVQLQILDASEYTGESRSNAVRELRITPARGTITDRNGRLIVDNEPAYTVLIAPRYFDESRAGLLARLLEIPDSVVTRKLAEARRWSPYRPSPAFRSVPFDAISRLLEHRDRLPGVTYEWEQKRRYVAPFRAAHVLGYVREIPPSMLERRQEEGYRAGDLIGLAGVERGYESQLRGRMGSAFRLVNVHGQEVEAFKRGAEDIPPISGRDIMLTIDYETQALAESLFVGKRGAAVAIDPQTGEILALVSKPDFDPDVMSRPISRELWNWFQSSADKPQFNRATQSLLSPGSTWKPFMALMALQEGAISPTSTVTCNGGHPIGRGAFLKCMHVHGTISVHSAIQQSCNTFFFEMMTRVDVETFSRYAHTFGFGEKAPLEGLEQDTGLIPDSSYFLKRNPRGWNVGVPISLGVGQGDMGVTPLQLARYVGAIGNGRWIHAPHVVKALRDPDSGQMVRPDLPEPVAMPFDYRNVAIVKNAMKAVMEEGTGRSLQIPGIPSGGKTGTAQNPRGKDDSVFIMFAPYDNPRIALGVIVENAGFGATAAGPIASLMAEKYLTGTLTPESRARMARVMQVTSTGVAVFTEVEE